MTRAILYIYNASFGLEETLTVTGLTALPGTGYPHWASCKWMGASNTGITEDFAHYAAGQGADGAFTGVPLVYLLDGIADGTNKEWYDETGAPTEDAVHTDWNERDPIDVATDWISQSNNGKRQDMVVESASSGGIPASGAHSTAVCAKTEGVMDPTSTTKVNTSTALVSSGVQVDPLGLDASGDTVPVRFMRPRASYDDISVSELDGTNYFIRALMTGSQGINIIAGWVEVLCVDTQPGTIEWVHFSRGAADGSGYFCGLNTATGGLPADITARTGETQFLNGGYCYRANRNKASPACTVQLGNAAGRNGNTVQGQAMSMCYRPNGVVTGAGVLMACRFGTGGGPQFEAYVVPSGGANKAGIYETGVQKALGTYTIPTTDVTYLVFVVEQETAAATVFGRPSLMGMSPGII